MIVIVGFMGAGKTTVGRLLAARLGLPFVDTDLVIEAREGRSIPAIFAGDGEAVFRDVEEAVVADVLGGPDAVVSLGGGACGRAGTRDLLRTRTVVHLDVSLAEARARTAGDASRPMLQRADLEELHAGRRTVFEDLADVSVTTDGRSAEAIALDVLDHLLGSTGIVVPAPGGTCRVVVRAGALSAVGEHLPPTGSVLVVARAGEPVLPTVLAGLAGSVRVAEVPVEDAEGSRAAGGDAIAVPGPHDLVLAVGDHAVADVARSLVQTHGPGVRWAAVPRSLQALLDPPLSGSEVLQPSPDAPGPVRPPLVVVCDPDGVTPATDPRFRTALAEAVQTALTTAPEDLGTILASAAGLLAGDPGSVSALVRRAVTARARTATVGGDGADPVHLAYGRTFSRGFEPLVGDEADALSLGLVAAAHLARRAGLLDDAGVSSHRRVLRALGLPTSHRFPPSDLPPSWSRDGGDGGDDVRFVLLRGPGRPEAGLAVDHDALTGALQDLAEDR